jgi:hypothetical protein
MSSLDECMGGLSTSMYEPILTTTLHIPPRNYITMSPNIQCRPGSALFNSLLVFVTW